jgi:curved DNA-binding protein CbpA
MESNLYECLQVSPRAGADVIQAAYRALARAYHPDLSADVDALQQMRKLNAAYEVLSDPRRRAQYDASRARPARAQTSKRAGRLRAPGIRLGRGVGPLVEHDTASPIPRIMLVLVITATLAGVMLVVWLIFDGL